MKCIDYPNFILKNVIYFEIIKKCQIAQNKWIFSTKQITRNKYFLGETE